MKFEPETVRHFYVKLLAFYPRAFREQFGESMRQTFEDVCRERIGRKKNLSFGFTAWLFAETFIGAARENLTEIKRRKFMENVVSDQKTPATGGLLLAMPFAILFLVEMNNIEPLSSFFKNLTTNANGQGLNVFGKVFILGSLFLLLAGFVVSFVPVARNFRSGTATHPFNLLIMTMLFFFIAALATGFVIDQYPCWIGVPNCD